MVRTFVNLYDVEKRVGIYGNLQTENENGQTKLWINEGVC